MTVETSAPLGELCAFLNGGTPSKAVPRFFEGEIPWITGADITSSIVTRSRTCITNEAVNRSATSLVPAGTVLLVTRTSVGKVAIAGVDLCFSQDITALIPDAARLHPPYLVEFLRSQQNHLERRARGATIKGITRDVLYGLNVPLPPIEEQRRIADILDRADALRAKRREALAQLDALAQSVFVDMFGDPVTNPMGWPESRTLGDIAEIVSGVTKGRRLTGKNTRTVPYLAVSNVQDKHLDLSTIKTIEATEQEICRFRLRNGDLLLTEGGDPDKLGRGTIWRDELPECIHQNHVFRVRITSESAIPVFMNWLIGSSRGKRYFLRSAKQTTGIASINMTQLKGFPLLVPPREIQQEFAIRIAKIEELRASHCTALVELNALFASLQHRAFRGEL